MKIISRILPFIAVHQRDLYVYLAPLKYAYSAHVNYTTNYRPFELALYLCPKEASF